MLESIKIYTTDEYWKRIFTDLGACLVDSSNLADVNFDDVGEKAPLSLVELQNILIQKANHSEIISRIFGKNVVLPSLQHKIIVILYKNPDINMNELKNYLGLTPDITTHTVENAIYQLRKNYGRDFILNTKGKYKIGKL